MAMECSSRWLRGLHVRGRHRKQGKLNFSSWRFSCQHMPGFPWDPRTPGEVLAGQLHAQQESGGAGAGTLEPWVLAVFTPCFACKMGEKSHNNVHDQCSLLVPRETSQARAERNKCCFFARTKCQNKSSDSGNYHFYVGLVVADLKQTTLTYMWCGLLIWEIVYLPETLKVWNINIKRAQYDIKNPPKLRVWSISDCQIA